MGEFSLTTLSNYLHLFNRVGRHIPRCLELRVTLQTEKSLCLTGKNLHIKFRAGFAIAGK